MLPDIPGFEKSLGVPTFPDENQHPNQQFNIIL
jgi:hypothetical protein